MKSFARVFLTFSGLSIGLIACGDDPAPRTDTPTQPQPGETPGANEPVEEGVWGGDEASLTVQPGGALWRQNCFSGEISSPLTTDSQGNFETQGTFRSVGDDNSTPATFRGRVQGERMTLEVVTEGDQRFADELELGFEGPLPPICSSEE